MLLQKTLGLKEGSYLIESSFEGLDLNLKTLDYLDKLGMLPEGSVESAIVIVDKGGDRLGAAFKNKYPEGDFWFVVPYPSAKAARQQTEKLAEAVLSGGIAASVKKKKVDAGALKKALREYLAVSLAEGDLCECDKDREPKSFAYNDKRNKRVGTLLEKLAKKHGFQLKKMNALEICCGNGMSTAAIRPLFNSVLSVDNDKCAVCNGIYHRILEPADVMVADAMDLTRYVDEKYDAVLGFMLGTIYEFNKNIWHMIFEESIKALKDGGFLFLTVNNKEEMDFLAGAFTSMGIRGTVIDNRNKGDIYDGWAFFAVNKDGRSGH
jgi:SAM-dependent methyltransferase